MSLEQLPDVLVHRLYQLLLCSSGPIAPLGISCSYVERLRAALSLAAASKRFIGLLHGADQA